MPVRVSSFAALLCVLGTSSARAAESSRGAEATGGTGASRSLELAHRALAGLRYSDAFSSASRGLEAGDATPAELVALYRAQGIAAAVLGEDAAAERAYLRMLSLSPGEQLPADSAPKLLRPLELARDRLGGAHLKLEARSSMLVEGWVRTEVSVTGDLLGLVQGVELQPLLAEASSPLRSSGRQFSWRCASAPCPHRLLARDAAGNVLLTLGSEEAPLAVIPLPSPDKAARPLWNQPLPYAIGGAGLGIAAGLFAWQFQQAQAQLLEIDRARGEHTFAEAQRADQLRRNHQLGMIASLAGAALLGTVAVVLW